MRTLFLFLALQFATVLCGNHTFNDYARIVSQDGEREIENLLAQIDREGRGLYLINTSKVQIWGHVAQNLKSSLSGHNIVVAIGWNEEEAKWAYEMLDDRSNAGIADTLETMFDQVFRQRTNNGTALDGTVVRQTFVDFCTQTLTFLRAISARFRGGQVSNLHSVSPFLPVKAELADKIQWFGDRIEQTFVPEWENLRRVHVSLDNLTQKDFDDYIVELQDFAVDFKTEVKAMADYLIHNSDIKSMYASADAPIFDQPVNLINGGYDFKGSRYYERARVLFKHRLNSGKIPQMLAEIAELEYGYAYVYLHWLYDMAGMKTQYLSLDKTMKRDTLSDVWGRYTKWNGYNEYKLDLYASGGAGVSLPVFLVARLGGGAKYELFKLTYRHRFNDIRWEMHVACSSAFTEGAIGGGTDFKGKKKVSPGPSASAGAGVSPTPVGIIANSSSTKAYQYYPPIYFRDPGYRFRTLTAKLDGGGNTVSATLGYTMAGDLTFQNGNRLLGLDATGINYSLNLGQGIGGLDGEISGNAQAVIEVGAGGCRGYDVTNYVGLPATLKSASSRLPDSPLRYIKGQLISFPSDAPTLERNDKDDLNRVVNDIRLFRENFPTKVIHVDVSGFATGIWSAGNTPADFSTPFALTGADKEAYANYVATEVMINTVRQYIIDQLNSLGVSLASDGVVHVNLESDPSVNWLSSPAMYKATLDSRIGSKMDWDKRPSAWRMILVTLKARE